MPQISTEFHQQSGTPQLFSVADLEKHLQRLSERVKRGLDNLSDFVFMFNLDGHPMQMDNYRAFTDFFQAVPPKTLMAKTCRQVGKTQQATAANVTERMVRPGTRSLIVTPFFNQAHRLSTEVAAPMLTKSLFRDSILEGSVQQVLKRRYANGSVDHYSYALADATRIRSIAGIDRLWIDEVQNVHADVFPVIEATQYARPLTGWKWFTGTPLSMSNLTEILWQQSSQAEEAVKCTGCNSWNYACTEWHLLNMIGEDTAICYKCGKKLDVYSKVFVPKIADREEHFQGRHMSQILSPLYTETPSAWRDMKKRISSPNYTKAQLYNEVFGESFDSADRMISQPELIRACVLGPNTFEEALHKKKELAIPAIGVDWTGGGVDSASYTKIVFGGLPPNSNEIKVLYMHSFSKSMPPQEQIAQVLKMTEQFAPSLFCHDFTGAGWLFETLGLSWKLSRDILMPFTYGFHPSREMIYADEFAQDGARTSLHIDRTRSLLGLFTMIKAGKVLFPNWDQQRDPETGTRPVDDFLNLFTEASPSWRSGDILFVKTDPKKSDDYVHAVNLMAAGCWYIAGALPSVPQVFGGGRTTVTREEADDMEGRFDLPLLHAPKPQEKWLVDEDDDEVYDPRKHMV